MADIELPRTETEFLNLQAFVRSQENRCFVCGPGNERGLRLEFQRDGEYVFAEFRPEEWQQGWTGVVHGGILASVLDEVMAYVLFFSGIRGVTARMEIRYRRPVTAGAALRVEASIVSDSRRVTDVQGRVMHGPEIVAEAQGRFMKLGAATVDDFTALSEIATSIPNEK